MACMEHACGDCHNRWFNNKEEIKCPECGSKDVSNWFDEANDDFSDIVELEVIDETETK